MKKSLVLFFILSGLALLFLPAALVVANRGREDITVTQEVLSGNPDAAVGITLTTASHWDGHLLWNTEYTPTGTTPARSEFSFSGEGATWEWTREKSATLAFNASVDLLDTDAYSAWNAANFVFPKIAQQLMYRASEEEYSETVRIGDYYSTYPVVFRLTGISVDYGFYQDACNFMTGFFHIPTGDEKLKITIYQSAGSKERYFQGENVPDADNIVIASASAFGRDGIYYTYCLENPESGECVERGQNRGIFFFPFSEVSKYSVSLEWEKLENVCEFPPDMVPLKMHLNEDETYLYIVARQKGEYSLLVYSLDHGVVLQHQIALDRQEHSGSFCRMHFIENGILLTWDDNYFSFVAEENGEYRYWCSGIFPETPMDGEAQNPFPWENACAFDGKRLALAAFENWYGLSVYLAVYDEGGQIYCGHYHNSQDAERKISYGNKISPQGEALWSTRRTWLTRQANAMFQPIHLKLE